MSISYLNPINIIIFSILILSIQIFLFNHLNKINLFLDKDFLKPQSYHSISIPRIGGTLLFVPVTLFFLKDINDHNNIPIYLICILCFFIGFFDDIKYLKNPKKKFILLSSIILLITLIFNLKIVDFKIEFFDEINKNFLISSCIFFCCIFTVVNGANLIDGFNGLLILNLLIISLALLIVSQKVSNFYVFENCLFFIISILFLLYLNFPNAKIFMGDSGAYFSGSFIALMSVELNSETSISPFFLANLNLYFFTEILFSIFRKLAEKKSPFLPDNMHLHMLVYKTILKKQKKNIANFTSSVIINIYFFIFICISLIFYNNDFISKVIFINFILFYILIYFFLRKYNAKK